LAKGWCDGGQDVDALADVAEHRCGADAEPVGQGGESRSDTAEIMPGRPPTAITAGHGRCSIVEPHSFGEHSNSVKRDVAILQERIKAMSDAKPSDKSPEQLRAELGEIRAELGDTVEELVHRVDVPARVRAQKEDTIARLQASKDQAAQHVQESAEKARAVLVDKVGQARTAYSEKAPPAVQQRVERARAVLAEKAPVVQQQVSKMVSDATPVVQQQVAKARNVLAEKAPPVERTLREKPGVVAAVAVALVALLIFSSRKK
jgi:hypothetical protein